MPNNKLIKIDEFKLTVSAPACLWQGDPSSCNVGMGEGAEGTGRESQSHTGDMASPFGTG